MRRHDIESLSAGQTAGGRWDAVERTFYLFTLMCFQRQYINFPTWKKNSFISLFVYNAVGAYNI